MCRSRAFSLIELLVVVVIITIIGAIAAVRLTPTSEHARFRGTHAQFAAFERALHYYFNDYAAYPPDKYPAIAPPALTPYLCAKSWTTAPSIGGRWDWNNDSVGHGVPTHGPNIAITVQPGAQPVALWQRFDRFVDNGSLSSGLYRRLTHSLLRPVQ